MNVLIADKFSDQGMEALRQAGCEVIFDPELKDDALTNAITEVKPSVLIVRSTKVQKPMLEAGTDLKVVIRAGSGYDTIDTATAGDRNVRVCNCPGMNAVAVAELSIGLMISLDRRIVDETVDLRNAMTLARADVVEVKARPKAVDK